MPEVRKQTPTAQRARIKHAPPKIPQKKLDFSVEIPLPTLKSRPKEDNQQCTPRPDPRRAAQARWGKGGGTKNIHRQKYFRKWC